MGEGNAVCFVINACFNIYYLKIGLFGDTEIFQCFWSEIPAVSVSNGPYGGL